jgi:hypothetical protein
MRLRRGSTSASRPDRHFLLAVPDEVLKRCGVILARMAREENR